MMAIQRKRPIVSNEILCILFLCWSMSVYTAQAWSVRPFIRMQQLVHPFELHKPWLLSITKFNYDDNDKSPPLDQYLRASIVGVSVERNSGFWIVLGLPLVRDISFRYVALQVTSHPLEDRRAATSGQALTLVQLLSGVDMAGTILPPHILAQLVVCAMEEENDEREGNDLEEWKVSLLNNVHQQIHSLYYGQTKPLEGEDDELSYKDSSLWIRSRVKLPLCTLDQVHLSIDQHPSALPSVKLDVAIKSEADLTWKQAVWSKMPLKNQIVAQVLLEDYFETTSLYFLATALSLRYKAPLLVSVARDNPSNPIISSPATCPFIFYQSMTELQNDFPLFRPVDKLRQSSDRVVQTIQRGFQVYQLQAAFTIARQKQDFAAMAKIQAKLDELDDTADLPVQPESDVDSME